MEYTKIETATKLEWKTPKQSVEGVLKGRKIIEGQKGQKDNLFYTVELATGKRVGFFGTAILNDALSEFHDGDALKIVYTGEGKKKAGQNAMKEFEVYRGN